LDARSPIYIALIPGNQKLTEGRMGCACRRHWGERIINLTKKMAAIRIGGAAAGEGIENVRENL
jgi:hypothetical protein